MRKNSLIVGITGTDLDVCEIEFLKHPTIRGVILFSRNYQSPEQLLRLTTTIHQLRSESPLLVFVDQEGGRVQRFVSGFAKIPDAQTLSDNITKDTPSITDCAWYISSQLKACGIDVNFAPVVDVDHGTSTIIGNRSFSSDPTVVAQLAKEYCVGVRQSGMPTCIKHFPGHGFVTPDSHLTLPRDPRSYKELKKDITPFAKVITFGVSMVMTAHIVYDNADSLPATFSPWWLRNNLRDQLGFEGVIVSDDLEMRATSHIGPMSDRVLAAFDAGCDWLLVCKHRELVLEAIEAASKSPGESRQLTPGLQASHNPQCEQEIHQFFEKLLLR